ncbi:hypothetical protein [Paracoccus jeotgali]|uniref:Uncharacterized protein n=1 Tax=Paracoccus jeotgali TaxID=2065379 RepID=A0A2K9MGL7_9RHOB|nr:hypothetical protein [Paracoccus jeotgali]AUM74789.1 hypothetical protein CYR75_11305 [Paracoccus jeotgali]
MTLSILLPLASLAAAVPLTVYCLLLSRRLRRLNNLESGLGAAIAVMTSEISRLDQSVRRARSEAETASNELAQVIEASRQEKAYWALQTRLAGSVPQPPRRLRPRAVVAEDAHV